MTARIIDGKAVAARLRARAGRARRGAVLPPRPARGARGRGPGLAASMSATRTAPRRRPASTAPPSTCRPTPPRPRCSPTIARAERRPGGGRHPGAAAAAAADPRRGRDRRGRSGEGRGRLPSAQCRAARRRASRAWCPARRAGVMHLLARGRASALRGARAVVLGRVQIVGRPMAQLLLAADCTVTIAHSRTRDLAAECRRAEILVAAVGRPEMVRGDWIAPGAVVIDVGINRLRGRPAGRRRRLRRGAAARRRHHAGARRRRADDHRLPAREHAGGGAGAPGDAMMTLLSRAAGGGRGRRDRLPGADAAGDAAAGQRTGAGRGCSMAGPARSRRWR